MGFNYTDAFSSSSQVEYESEQHDNAVQLQGRRTYIFKLDKESTVKSEVYNEAKTARIYLPHFEQRALYNTNEWQNSIGLNNFMENEENIEFEYNFARMVCNIRDLKDKNAGELTIVNLAKEPLNILTENNKFTVKTYKDVLLLELNMDEYKSIKILLNDVNKKCSLIKVDYNGDSESTKSISSINKRLVPNKKYKINVVDSTYQNCTDVIESGDIILTDKYKLYQVRSVYPSGTMMNNYISWVAKANTLDLSMASLPDDYRKIVERNRYGLPKTDKE